VRLEDSYTWYWFLCLVEQAAVLLTEQVLVQVGYVPMADAQY
jgi:hypothetical protein